MQTRWSDALGRDETFRLQDSEGLVREVRTRLVDASQEKVFRAFTSIGGEKGWLVWEWAWEIRGFVDQLLGGPGLRRGRRHPTEVSVGEVVDFWRVEEIEEPSLFRLRAEMKVPGQAWLQWEAKREEGQDPPHPGRPLPTEGVLRVGLLVRGLPLPRLHLRCSHRCHRRGGRRRPGQ